MTQTLDFTNVSTANLVSVHNLCTRMLGGRAVTRFADRPTAEKRVRFLLSQINPEKRPEPFRVAVKAADPKVAHYTGTEGVNLDVPGNDLAATRRKPTPQVAALSGMAPLGFKVQAAIAAHPEAKQPTPALAVLKVERWQRPKRVEPARVAYRPAPGRLQHAMYSLLTQPGGIAMSDFCAKMKASGTKDSTLFLPSGVWGALRYLYVASRGYGLWFDGERLGLICPADERDTPAKAKV